MSEVCPFRCVSTNSRETGASSGLGLPHICGLVGNGAAGCITSLDSGGAATWLGAHPMRTVPHESANNVAAGE